MKQPIIYTLLFVLLTASGCSFIANANEQPEKKVSDESSFYDVKMETKIEEYDAYHITIHYPQTSNNQIDQTIVDYVNQQKARFKKESYRSKRSSEVQGSHELHIDFEVIHQNARFFVVRFIETMDIGGEELITDQTVMNFDKKIGKNLNIGELFKDNIYYVDRLHEWTIEKLEENESEYEQTFKGLEATPETYENIALLNDGIMVYLENPENKETVEVFLELDKVSSLLRSSYVKAIDQLTEKDQEADIVKESISSGEMNNSFIDKNLNSNEKKVALTFDDGPHPKVTTKILDILDQHEVKASFFMIGKRVSYYPNIAREVGIRGHEIGNHTWNHPRLNRLRAAEIDHQISSTQRIIEQVTGQHPDLVRLPFGEPASIAYNGDLNAVPWTIYSEKWREQEPVTIVQDILSQAEDGSIILLHDLENYTVETVDFLLERLNSEGYQVVPVGEL
ncbi:Peptidoglycan/xylan/chitin deacetylase, PgdA/CDA1 family [Halobacillus dabanensis]|uniref:Peptidoglycan/xylan/chitin deacetylase, PgdA/CDA1 family n=1 Tax=Halobacillus dabanensis TaxID=240302 RepID=A0A1I3Z8K6_HALDA|nr:polysaccharide deacetylase family protein [Halobacillus dabanensis]SFK40362.1 Peptidoglycan/xylan/chitin deacetylase, PgdA/CDA1 family [Halobacillus dabanensis]